MSCNKPMPHFHLEFRIIESNPNDFSYIEIIITHSNTCITKPSLCMPYLHDADAKYIAAT